MSIELDMKQECCTICKIKHEQCDCFNCDINDLMIFSYYGEECIVMKVLNSDFIFYDEDYVLHMLPNECLDTAVMLDLNLLYDESRVIVERLISNYKDDLLNLINILKQGDCI